jgi:hypothetical protein
MSRSYRINLRHWDAQLTVKSKRAGAMSKRTALASWIGISLLLWAVIFVAANWFI